MSDPKKPAPEKPTPPQSSSILSRIFAAYSAAPTVWIILIAALLALAVIWWGIDEPVLID